MKSRSEIEVQEKIKSELAYFIGTESYHKINGLLPRVVMTDGAKYVAESCQAYWLMEEIGFWVMKNRLLVHSWGNLFCKFQVIRSRGRLTIERDEDVAVYVRRIDWTTFPLDEIKLWVEPAYDPDGHEFYVILLPSEH